MKATQRPGSMIVEVLVGISVAALVIVSVGNLVDSVNKTARAAGNKNQALAYARESLEVVTAIARTELQCSGGGCPCTPLAGYTMCWRPCPVSVPTCTTGTEYQIAKSASTWLLANGRESLASSPVYTRWLTIADGTNADQKEITTTVGWVEGNRTPSVTMSTTLSVWK